jgi:integrase
MRWQTGYLMKKHGAWHVRYYITEMVDGQPKPKQISKRIAEGDLSKKEAKKACAEFMAKVNDERRATPGSPVTGRTIADFWEKVYVPFIKQNLKVSTAYQYQQLWETRMGPHFGTMLLKDYRTSMGTKFLTEQAQTFAKATVGHMRSLGSGVFAHAVALGEVETNPWHDVKILGKTKEKPETKHYTLEEIENIISALVNNVECQLIMALAFFLGLRKGEIEGLQWGDIDKEWLHVRRSKWNGTVGEPKTKKSIRSIPAIQPVPVLLGLWKKKCADTSAGVFIFPHHLNHYARTIIRPCLEKEKLQWKGFHAGRRGLGTVLRELTGNSNAGKNVLGHSTTQMTEEKYEKAMPEEALKGMRLLEERSQIKQGEAK